MEDIIRNAIKENIKLKEFLLDSVNEIKMIAETVIKALKGGNKILIAGNGGSCADAQHFAAELVGRFKQEKKPLPCIALTTNTSVLTSISNDYSFDDIFSKQIEAIGKRDDIFIGLSTSGNSKNILKGINVAKDKGMKTIALLGKDGGFTRGGADLELIIPSACTARIQETHILILHIIAELIERCLISKRS